MSVSAKQGPTFGRMLLALTCKLRGTDILGKLKQIENAPFRSREEIRNKQFQDIRALLAHAEAKVPYYRNLFRQLGMRSEDVRTWGDFSRIPILTKDIIRANQQDLIREDIPIERLSPHFSGGSTGVPLKFFRSREYMVASDAGTYRNLEQCGWRPGEMIAFFWGGSDKLYRMSRLQFEMRQFVRRQYQFDPFFSGDQDMLGWIGLFERIRPGVILGYASTIARFAAFIESRGKKLNGVKGVFTTAEKIYRPQREVIERVFGCKVFDSYGSSEVQNIAAECPAGRMHINADFVVVEEDEAEADGPRPFLLTSLQNFSMPFIRYRNEDCGYLSEEMCSCPNHFPLMRLEIARTSDNFLLPGGRVVHGEFFTHLMYGSDGIVNFQFHQTSLDEIVLSIVPGAGAEERRDEKIRDSIRQIQELSPGRPIRVEVRYVESIPLSSAGKHRFTRSDVNAQAPAEPAPAGRS
ncbi:MAG: phenylacetate--CoA ligase family protein [Acidobacteriaceae bacterium]|nr:phenylacetate--CoA ligase family protein [Acidobacteriaceae bacterium]